MGAYGCCVGACVQLYEGARACSGAGAGERKRSGVRPRTVSRNERRGKTRRLGGEEGVERQGLKVVGITQVGRMGEWIVEG